MLIDFDNFGTKLSRNEFFIP